MAKELFRCDQPQFNKVDFTEDFEREITRIYNRWLRLEEENATLRAALLRARVAGLNSKNFSAQEATNLARWIDSGFSARISPPDEWVKSWILQYCAATGPAGDQSAHAAPK